MANINLKKKIHFKIFLGKWIQLFKDFLRKGQKLNAILIEIYAGRWKKIFFFKFINKYHNIFSILYLWLLLRLQTGMCQPN